MCIGNESSINKWNGIIQHFMIGEKNNLHTIWCYTPLIRSPFGIRTEMKCEEAKKKPITQRIYIQTFELLLFCAMRESCVFSCASFFPCIPSEGLPCDNLSKRRKCIISTHKLRHKVMYFMIINWFNTASRSSRNIILPSFV